MVDIAECGGLVVGGGYTGKIDYCTASGTVIAQGNEAVGLGGIAGCMQNMESVTGNIANVTIEAGNGHAIGGLAGYTGNGDDGSGTIGALCKITDSNVIIDINTDGATHVGGLIGTGLYYYGMEGRFTIDNCAVTGSIDGAVTPGSVAGRAVGSTITSCTTNVTVSSKVFNTQIGTTDTMYESGDQYENTEEASTLIDGLFGTYEGLFGPVTLKSEYNDIRTNYCTIILGKDNADETVNKLKASIGGLIYGQEAVEAYENDPSSMKFCCELINGVNEITFNGTEISGTDSNDGSFFHIPIPTLTMTKQVDFMSSRAMMIIRVNSLTFSYGLTLRRAHTILNFVMEVTKMHLSNFILATMHTGWQQVYLMMLMK